MTSNDENVVYKDLIGFSETFNKDEDPTVAKSLLDEQTELSELLNNAKTDDDKMLAQSLVDLLDFFGPIDYYFEAKKEVLANMQK